MLTDQGGPAIPVSGQAGVAAGIVLLPVDWQGQPQGSDWCWAACCAMILTANGTPTSVQGAAELVLGDSPAMDDEERPGDALTAVGLPWMTKPGGVGAPLSANSMQQWIAVGRRPVEIYWLYDDQTGHVGLVTGYNPANGGTWRLLDPLQDCGWVSYEYLSDYNGQGQWDNSFYAIGNAL